MSIEILIPGLILVALMAYASTRIKKRAAEAFDAELIETGEYSLRKPEGFLHVVGDKKHEFLAYSKEFGEDDNARFRRATIELDVIPGSDVATVCRSIREAATRFEIREEGETCAIADVDEQANETEFRAVYLLAARGNSVYRLRFAVLAEHFDEYVKRIDDTVECAFNIKQA